MKIVTGSKLDELKEKFVHGRFAEKKFFCRADVVEWLEKQKQANKPDFVKRFLGEGRRDEWTHMITLLHISEAMVPLSEEDIPKNTLLKMAGFRLEDRQVITNPELHIGTLYYELEYHASIALLISKEVYFIGDALLAFPFDQKGEVFPVRLCPGMTKGGSYASTYLTQDIAQSLLMSWDLLGESDPRKYRARAILCNWLKRCIAKVKAGAEKEFDEAVAVSEDGQTIVSADWVVEWEQTDHDAMYSVQAVSKDYYHKRKTVRAKKLIRLDEQIINMKISALDAQAVKNLMCEIFHFSLDDVGKQYFCTLKNSVTGDTCTCFVTF